MTPQGSAAIRQFPFVRTAGRLFWEDDRHVLGTYVRGERMAVARVGLSGEISIAGPWRLRDRDGFAFLS